MGNVIKTGNGKNDMIHWLRYFLIGIRHTAVEAVETLSSILKLKDEMDARTRDR